MQKKIAVVVTNQDQYPGKDRPTGLWLSELVHFWDILEPEGYSFDIVSPKGGKIPLEPKSLHGVAFDRATKKRYEDKAFMARLDDSMAAANVGWESYEAVYYTGGHGVMYDFPDDDNLQRLNRDLYENGRVVSAVCHGYCALLNTKLSDGNYLIKDKEITGFTWFEEKLSGVAKIVPYNAEQIAKDRGSKFRKSLIPLRPYVQVDGKLITGQNPFSATLTAQKVLDILKQ
ncbi:MAG: type 1 glutamine amidotransferase domain-containing protein [Methyloligellaceae bacterium]